MAVAQEPRATLVGLVTDSTGGVVPGARLTAIHLQTESRYSTESNTEGYYVIPYLPAGTVRLRVVQNGFRTGEVEDILVRAGDRLRVDAVLQLGSVVETVRVTPDYGPLQAETASFATVIDPRRVAELPIAHGNPYLLAQLSAGVAFAGNGTMDRPFEPSHIANFAMSGAYALRNDITLDGSPNESMTAGRNQTAAAYVPPLDIVEEIRIATAPLDATTGHTEGGVIAITLKSGSNTPHATAYYNNQNPALFANSWMANKRGQPRPDFQYNRWGGSLSGPVKLPRFYDGASRTFFLWGYEGIHEQRPRTLGDQTVPTAEERYGDFSALLAQGPTYQLYDPATRRPGPSGGMISDPFPGNIIPGSRIDPIARNILRYFALPNATGTADGQNNLARPNLAESIGYYNHAWRLDHNLGDRHHLFGSAAMYRRISDYLNYFDNPATGEVFGFASRRAAVDDVITLSPVAVVNLRYGYSRFIREADLNPASHGFDLTSLAPGNAAWAAWNRSIDSATRRFPLIDIAGYYDLVGTSSSGVLRRPQDTHAFGATLDRVAGSHAFALGAEYRVYRKGEYNPYPASNVGTVGGSTTGWLKFSDDWTKGPTDTSPAPPIGAGLASFLLGLPTGGGVVRQASFAEQSTVMALHFQDNWKIARRLTLMLGLRYEVEGPLTERYNRSVRAFDPSAALPIAPQILANYARIAAQIPERPADTFPVSGGVTFAGVDGQPRTLYNRDTNNLMPRVGLALRLDAHTAVRAGYGIFFGAMGIRRGDVYQSGFSKTTPLIPSADNGRTFVATLDNPFPQGALNPRGASLGAMTNAGDAISYFNPDYVAPYLQRWQFSLQRELPGLTLLDLAYVGSRGTKIETTRNPDGIPLQYLSRSPVRDQQRIDYLGRQELDNPYYGVLPASTTLGGARKISRGALLTAFPQFTSMETTTNQGFSWYHSLQATVNERFSHGHTIGGSYTWSKFMEAVSYLNPMDGAPYRTISSADRPHRLSASWIFELPFGRGRRLGARAPKAAAALIGGWQIEGLYVHQSGAPLDFGNVTFSGDIKTIALPADRRRADRWFNTEAGFVRDSSQALAYNVRTFPLRFSGVRGPAIDNFDLSALKNSRVADRATLQFRAEFLNAFNRAWFSNPNTTPTSSTFGVISSEMGNMRRIQLGLKLLY